MDFGLPDILKMTYPVRDLAVGSDGRYLFEMHDSIIPSADAISQEFDLYTSPMITLDGAQPEMSE